MFDRIRRGVVGVCSGSVRAPRGGCEPVYARLCTGVTCGNIQLVGQPD